jgi:hypothetical protein
LFARGFTWISDDMAEPDQLPVAAALDPSASVQAAVARE